jgi:hypothetical protein
MTERIVDWFVTEPPATGELQRHEPETRSPGRKLKTPPGLTVNRSPEEVRSAAASRLRALHTGAEDLSSSAPSLAAERRVDPDWWPP